VHDRKPLVRVEPATRPVLFAGDGEGVVEAAEAGLLRDDAPLLYSAALARDTKTRAVALAAGADLVLTDSNRRRARRWSTVRENTGYTEQAGEKALVRDLGDARLPVFPDAKDDAFTVAQQRGVRAVRASRYGNRVTYTPEDRPAMALDGDPATAWRVDAFDDPRGERLLIELQRPVTTDHVTLLQPVTGPRNRYITRATLRFDRGKPLTVDLTDASRQQPGQRIDIGRRAIRTLEIEVDATNAGTRDRYVGLSAVGLAEVGIGDVHADEVVRLPTDLLATAGPQSQDHRLTILLARARSAQLPPRSDEELALARTFTLSTARTFSLAGTARVSANADDATVDRALGAGGVHASSSGRLPGNLRARPSLALDGDPATFWSSGLGQTDGTWLAYDLSAPFTVDHLDLAVVADGRHSVPTRLRVEAGGQAREVEVPPLADSHTENAVAQVQLSFPPLTGNQLRVTVVRARKVMTRDWYSDSLVALPVGVAELGAAGVRADPPPNTFPDGCHTDLLTVDGRAVGVRFTGTRDQAEGRQGLAVEACGPDAGGMTLGPGPHELRTRAGRDTGIDLDRLVLDSAGAAPAPEAGPSPRVDVVDKDRTSYTLRVRDATRPFWLVLGQSHNQGWTATSGGRSLGPPQLVNGYANGWYVRPHTAGAAIDVHLEWTPQRRVWWALALSAIGVVVCLGLALVDPRRGPPRAIHVPSTGPELASPLRLEPVSSTTRTRVGATVAAGLGATLLAGLPTGLIVAAAVLATLVRPSARVILTVGSVAGIALAALYTAGQQIRYHYAAQFEWPTRFHAAHVLAWLAVLLLAGDALLEGIRRRRADP
jgi:hypothetical protein